MAALPAANVRRMTPSCTVRCQELDEPDVAGSLDVRPAAGLHVVTDGDDADVPPAEYRPDRGRSRTVPRHRCGPATPV